MRQEGEPTVEEILESIKKVIARDNRADAAEDRRRKETAGVSPAAEPEDVLDLADSATFLDDDVRQEDPPLLNEDCQASMRESLQALSLLAEPGAPPQIVRSGETSLEGLVRELLRPALSDWLDKNLPPLVERMVAAEIKRITGKRG